MLAWSWLASCERDLRASRARHEFPIIFKHVKKVQELSACIREVCAVERADLSIYLKLTNHKLRKTTEERQKGR